MLKVPTKLTHWTTAESKICDCAIPRKFGVAGCFLFQSTRFLLGRLYRILRKGTMRGYASVAFSPHNKAGCWSVLLLPSRSA